MRKNLSRTADPLRDAVQQLLHIEISTQGRKGLDIMKQMAIIAKQASKQASKVNYVLNPVCLQYLLSRDAA